MNAAYIANYPRRSHIGIAKVPVFAVTIRLMHNLIQFSNSRGAIMPGKEEEISKIFARNFKRAREEAELTQDQVAQIMGWTQPFMSDIENGKKGVTLNKAKILADVVKQPLCKLLSSAEK